MPDRASARPGPTLARTAPSSSQGVIALAPRRQRAIARKRGRDRAIEVVAEAMVAERADAYDVAEALGVNDRVARRVIDGGAPFELGDLIALARSGRGGARLARGLLRRLEKAVDEVVDEATFPLRQHG